MSLRTLSALLLAATLCACGNDDRTATNTGPSEPILAALADTRRLETDRDADAGRRPGVVLEFFGIEPGMTVLDLFSGTGYYTELVYRIVGDAGTVWAHNNAAYLANREPLQARYGDGRLASVRRVTAENNELDLPAESFDAVLMILTYHDIYFVNESIGWTRIDGPGLLAELYQSMRPGAVLGVVDHAAAPGSPGESGNSLHRIDPALARREIEAAGFVFDAESTALRNLDDDLTQNVFADGIRGRTDRFVFRFRKP